MQAPGAHQVVIPRPCSGRPAFFDDNLVRLRDEGCHEVQNAECLQVAGSTLSLRLEKAVKPFAPLSLELPDISSGVVHRTGKVVRLALTDEGSFEALVYLDS